MPSSPRILCCPLLLLSPVPPSIRDFSNESTLHMRWPKYWSFSFSISPSNEHPGLISFRMDWMDLLAVQGTLSLLQHHSSKASILQCSAFFMVQLSHPQVSTGSTNHLQMRISTLENVHRLQAQVSNCLLDIFTGAELSSKVSVIFSGQLQYFLSPPLPGSLYYTCFC